MHSEFCSTCEREMQKEYTNIRFETDDGIEVFIQGGVVLHCFNCRQEMLPNDLKKYVDDLLKQKKELFPYSPPQLHIVWDTYDE